jgi:D-alanine-D-alanine ligase
MRRSRRLILLAGGESAERDVSLASSASLLEALERLGHEVRCVDPADPDAPDGAVRETIRSIRLGSAPPRARPLDERRAARFVERLREERRRGAEGVVLGLHGGFGEDGTIQAVLRWLGIPFTGSGAEACAAAMHKGIARKVARSVGLAVPEGFVARRGEPLRRIRERAEGIGFPLVVKPEDQGSSVGFSRLEDPEALPAALERAWGSSDAAILERYVPGAEITAAILEGRALPLVEIRPRSGVYDYEHKYVTGVTEYLAPAPVAPEVTERVQRDAEAVFRALRCRVYGRVDFRLAPDGTPYFLEVNTLPGMTSHSLVPKAAKAAGMDFAALVDRIVEASFGRSTDGSAT